jgi:hypothetical protein
LPEAPGHFVVHVSADNRYRLFVNGQSVAAGPPQSDLRNWRFNTVDLGPYLKAGRNVLAAVVWNGGEHRPMAQISHRTGFLLQGDSEREQAVNTGAAGNRSAIPLTRRSTGGISTSGWSINTTWPDPWSASTARAIRGAGNKRASTIPIGSPHR